MVIKNKVLVCYQRDSEALYESENHKGLDYATTGSVGLDLRACFEEDSVHILAGERKAIPTGISIEILHDNVAGFVYSRSGLGAKEGLTVAQGVGVIDCDYRGEIVVFLLNTSHESKEVKKGDRIAQLLFQEAYRLAVVKTDTLSETQRGTGGFGHTGR